MGKYVLRLQGRHGMPETEEEQKRVMDAWTAWFGGLGDSVVDMGNPFGASAAVGGGGASGLTGYSIVSRQPRRRGREGEELPDPRRRRRRRGVRGARRCSWARPGASPRRRAGLALVAVRRVAAEIGERHRERVVLHLPDVAELVREQVVVVGRRAQENRVPGRVAVEAAKPRQPEEHRHDEDSHPLDPTGAG